MVEGLLGDGAPAHPGDVGGGDVKDVRRGARRSDGVVEGPHADHVGSERIVDGCVERDAGRGVEDDVEVRGELGNVLAHVPLQDLHPFFHHPVDRLPPLTLAERGEGRPPEEGDDAVAAGAARAPAHQEHDP
jgi:hypothetical protein